MAAAPAAAGLPPGWYTAVFPRLTAAVLPRDSAHQDGPLEPRALRGPSWHLLTVRDPKMIWGVRCRTVSVDMQGPFSAATAGNQLARAGQPVLTGTPYMLYLLFSPVPHCTVVWKGTEPVAWARLAGRVGTVGDERLAPSSAPAARTWAVAARCSAALLGLDAVNGDCWPSLGACNAKCQHVCSTSPAAAAAQRLLILLPRTNTGSAIFVASLQSCQRNATC